MDGNTVRRVTPTKEEFVFRFVSPGQQHTSLERCHILIREHLFGELSIGILTYIFMFLTFLEMTACTKFIHKRTIFCEESGSL